MSDTTQSPLVQVVKPMILVLQLVRLVQVVGVVLFNEMKLISHSIASVESASH